MLQSRSRPRSRRREPGEPRGRDVRGPTVPPNPERIPVELALPPWFEVGTYVVLALVLGFDLFIAFKRPHVPSTRESALWVPFYLTLALLLAGARVWVGRAGYSGHFRAASM